MKSIKEFDLNVSNQSLLSMMKSLDALDDMIRKQDKREEQLERIATAQKKYNDLLDRQKKLQKDMDKVMGNGFVNSISKSMKDMRNSLRQSFRWSDGIRKNLTSGAKAMGGLLKSGVLKIIDMAQNLFSSVLHAFEKYNGAMDENRQASILNMSTGKYNAYKDTEQQLGLNGLTESFAKSFRGLSDYSNDANFLKFFSQAQMDRFRSMEGLDAGWEMAQEMIKTIKANGGFDDKNARAMYGDDISAIGFDWDTLKALSKNDDLHVLKNGFENFRGVNQRLNSSERGNRYSTDDAVQRNRIANERRGKATEEAINRVTDNLMEQIAGFLRSLQPAVSKLLELVENYVIPVIKGLQEILIAVKDALVAIWDKFDIGSKLESGAEWVGDKAKKGKELLTSGVNKVTSFFSGDENKIKQNEYANMSKTSQEQKVNVEADVNTSVTIDMTPELKKALVVTSNTSSNTQMLGTSQAQR